MIKSMTAFARAEIVKDQLSIIAEIRSYNSRYLDVSVRLPREYAMLEERIKNLVSDRGIIRGRVEIRLQIEDSSEGAGGFEVDTVRAKSWYAAVSQLKNIFGMQDEIAIDTLISGGQLIKPAEENPDTEAHWKVIDEAISMALQDLDAMRKREGDFISQDFRTRLEQIENHLDHIENECGDLLPIYQQRLKERIESLTRGMVEIDPSRIAQEAAFLADRSDITEELVRARSHVKQFRIIMDSDESAGRKLNFLLQEFNREFNTMGAKTSSSGVSHRVVEVKSDLEKLREQVQNIE
jgi:uncharacterized protein (TIGR00255 family)